MSIWLQNCLISLCSSFIKLSIYIWKSLELNGSPCLIVWDSSTASLSNASWHAKYIMNVLPLLYVPLCDHVSLKIVWNCHLAIYILQLLQLSSLSANCQALDTSSHSGQYTLRFFIIEYICWSPPMISYFGYPSPPMHKSFFFFLIRMHPHQLIQNGLHQQLYTPYPNMQE